MKNAIIEVINQYSKFEIIAHEWPDEDAIGSSMALAHGLNALGKSVKVIFPNPPAPSMLLDPSPQEIQDLDPEISMILDVSDFKMLGEVKPQGTMVAIDHHRSHSAYAQIAWVDAQKSSTCEMIYEVLSDLNVTLTPIMAGNLYLGIFGDTGGFIHANTTERVFEIARELVRAGADANGIATRLKKNKSLKWYKLLAKAIEHLQTSGSIYATYLSWEDLLAVDAGPGDTSGIIGELASLAGAELSIFLRDMDETTVHCSMRSRSKPAALHTAEAFGGGGHNLAAGFSCTGRARDMLSAVMEEGKKWVRTE